MAKKTIIQARDQAESSDANRAFASIAAASSGSIQVLEADEDRVRELLDEGESLWIDGRILGRRGLPHLLSSIDHPEVLVISRAIDARVRVLKQQPREEDVIRIITALEVSAENGFDHSLALFKGLEDRGIDWHWYILGRPGDDEYFEGFIKHLEECDLADSVTMVGEYSLEKYLKLALNMDFAFFPGPNEGLLLTRLEALAMGIPTLCKRSRFLDDKHPDVHEYDDIDRELEDIMEFVLRICGAKSTRRVKRELPDLPSWKSVADRL